MTARQLLLGAALILSAGCRDATRPQPYRVWSHSLYATTRSIDGTTKADTVECNIQAHVPMPDSITTPWSGQVDVYASRGRPGSTYASSNMVTGKALLTLTRGAGDSLYVSLAGVVVVGLGGRVSPYWYNGATGAWTCDAQSSLPGSQPGEARGVWYLSPDIPID